MTRESYLKDLIKKNGFTIKDFANTIDMPYSTLLTILNKGKIGSAAVDNVIKICRGLNITIQELLNIQDAADSPLEHLVLSEHEKEVVLHYREKSDLQKAIDILLFSEPKQ